MASEEGDGKHRKHRHHHKHHKHGSSRRHSHRRRSSRGDKHGREVGEAEDAGDVGLIASPMDESVAIVPETVVTSALDLDDREEGEILEEEGAGIGEPSLDRGDEKTVEARELIVEHDALTSRLEQECPDAGISSRRSRQEEISGDRIEDRHGQTRREENDLDSGTHSDVLGSRYLDKETRPRTPRSGESPDKRRNRDGAAVPSRKLDSHVSRKHSDSKEIQGEGVAGRDRARERSHERSTTSGSGQADHFSYDKRGRIRDDHDYGRDIKRHKAENHGSDRDGRAGRESERAGRESERAGWESERAGRESERSGREIERAGRESERSGREIERAGRESERAGRESEISGRESERAGRESERSGREIERAGRESERAGRESERSGRESERSGRESERAGSRSRHDGYEHGRYRENTRDRYRERERSKGLERGRERDEEKGRMRSRSRERNRNGVSKYDGDESRDRRRDESRAMDRDRARSRERQRDSRGSRYDESREHRETRRESGSKGVTEQEEVEEKRREHEEKYEEKIEQQLAEQEEDDPEKIIKESRRRRLAILEKYKQKQQQEQQEPPVKESQFDDRAEVEKTSLAGDNELPENKNGASEVSTSGQQFIVEKSPEENSPRSQEIISALCALGAGTPKSEHSSDMFCDDIFGESPTGVRRVGKGDDVKVVRSGLHDNWDDAEGYYVYRFGEVLDGRYEVIASHGKGVFSTVVRAKDLKAGKSDPEEVAIKIIRSNEIMYKAGMGELTILKKLAGADPDDKRHCVRFLSSFKYRNHLCLVFESLHMNLREVLKKFGRNIGLKLTAVRAYAKQLFIALKHLRNCGVLHCDIKPDNMLVNEAKNVLKLCDFGNAMFAGKNEITPYLVSRFYRAPEIILGLTYDHPLDIWSVGCCLFELYAGKVLFPGPTNSDMLRLHMELKGPFPKKMLRKGAFVDHHFDPDLNFHATEEDPVTKKTVKRLLLNIKPKDFGALLTAFPGEDPKMLAHFKDLLERIFILDPDKRMTVAQALSHPFITGK
ncbi:protein kinase superfamily protein isoform X2 [Wolffia australiana]